MEEQLDMAEFEALFTLAIRHGMRLLTDLEPGRQTAAELKLPGEFAYFVARWGSARLPMVVVPSGVSAGGGALLAASAGWIEAVRCEGPIMLMVPEEQVEGAATISDAGGQIQAYAYRIEPPSFRRLL